MRIVPSLLAALAAAVPAGAFAPSLLPPSSLGRPSHGVPSAPAFPASSSSATSTPKPRPLGPLFMGWGPDPIWSTGTVENNIQACPSGSCVSLKISVPDGSDFIHPGQYVQVKVAGDDDAPPAFLAIASAPTGEAPKVDPPGRKPKKAEEADAAAGAPKPPVPATWEFLVKKTDNNSWITSANPGDVVDVSQVLGSGFPIASELDGFKYDFPTQNLLLFATGSGISPIRSAIESGRLNVARPDEGGRTCTLYYGVRTPDDMPYVSKFGEWEGLGVQVVPVVSRPDLPCASGAVWGGRTGYVQNALEEDGVPIPRNSGALLCGVKGMCESVRSMLGEAGVFEGRVLTNF